jgi:hypothetical protein
VAAILSGLMVSADASLHRCRELERLTVWRSPLGEQDHVNLVHATRINACPEVHWGATAPCGLRPTLVRSQSDPKGISVVPRDVDQENAGFGSPQPKPLTGTVGAPSPFEARTNQRLVPRDRGSENRAYRQWLGGFSARRNRRMRTGAASIGTVASDDPDEHDQEDGDNGDNGPVTRHIMSSIAGRFRKARLILPGVVCGV